jgi:hypothetical protein
MTVRIFRDVEEALAREVRRISYHESRTVDTSVLQDVFDPFTGEIVQIPIEADFYDSSADTKAATHPHFFIRLMKTREDRTSGRGVTQYGKWCQTPVKNAPKAYEMIVGSSDGSIATAGNDLITTIFNIRKVQPGYLLRLLNGNNKGTYTIDSIVVDNLGNHTITVSNDILTNLPSSVISFDTTNTKILFNEGLDVSAILAGDIYTDNSANNFTVVSADSNEGSITIAGLTPPDTDAGALVNRASPVFTLADPSLVRYMVLDPSQPIKTNAPAGETDATSSVQGVSPQVPLDLFYRIRIDSKEQKEHIHVLNRIWEEFNPPRTALPVVVRSAASAEQAFTVAMLAGETTITVEDNSNFNVNDPVLVFDDLTPGRNSKGEYGEPFETIITQKIGTNQLILRDPIPQDLNLDTCPKIVSNVTYQLYMFHFVDHATKDVEGSQYWVHEFMFWVQIWIDRLESPDELSVVTDISPSYENIEGGILD